MEKPSPCLRLLCIFRNYGCVEPFISCGGNKVLCNKLEHLFRISCRSLWLLYPPFCDLPQANLIWLVDVN